MPIPAGQDDNRRVIQIPGSQHVTGLRQDAALDLLALLILILKEAGQLGCPRSRGRGEQIDDESSAAESSSPPACTWTGWSSWSPAIEGSGGRIRRYRFRTAVKMSIQRLRILNSLPWRTNPD